MSETSKKHRSSQGRSALVRYCLMFFVSAWMFILGVLVGRGTAPVHFDMENIRTELTALRNAVIKKDREALENKTGKGFKKEDLGFYEALKKPDTGKPDNEVTFKIPVNKKPVQPKTKPVEIKKPVAPKPEKKSIRTAEKKTSLKAVTRKPKPLVEISRFTIQVAALKDQASANQMISGLKIKGYPAYLAKAEIKNKGTWYRVRVGGYPTRTQAGPVVKRLKSVYDNPIIVEK